MSFTTSFGILRARMEAELATPAVLLVTSAESRDGKSCAAFGLAGELASAGYRAAVLDATGSPVCARPRFDVVTFPSDGSTTAVAKTHILHAASQLRRQYDFTIVDAGILTSNSVAMSFADACDALLVAYRLGRRATPNDRRLIAYLAETKTRVLGIVATGKEALRAFDDGLRAQSFASPGQGSAKDKPYVAAGAL